jgi:WD40 repeat protein
VNGIYILTGSKD